MATVEKKLTLLDACDLDKLRVDKTRGSYSVGSAFYQAIYEFSLGMSIRTAANYLEDFINELPTEVRKPNVLVLGSGKGRDCLKLLLKGFRVTAVDYSPEMQEQLTWFLKDNESNLEVVVLDVEDLSQDFFEQDIDAAISESCLQHLNHPAVLEVFKKAYNWLAPGGIFHARVKVTDHGRAYAIEDGVGTRYFTSWRPDEIQQLEEELQAIGYELLTNDSQNKIIPHRDAALGVPGFYLIRVRKPKTEVSAKSADVKTDTSRAASLINETSIQQS